MPAGVFDNSISFSVVSTYFEQVDNDKVKAYTFPIIKFALKLVSSLIAQVTSNLEDMVQENRKFRTAAQEEHKQAKGQLNAEQNAFKSELENLTATVHEEQKKATELVKAEIQQSQQVLGSLEGKINEVVITCTIHLVVAVAN